MIEFMSEKHERLRQARISAQYKSAAAAAEALGITASTYRAHENGQNDFQIVEAEQYGKKFGTDPIWLLTGKETTTGAVNQPSILLPKIELPNATIRDKITGHGRLIPVFGQAVGGVDGEFIMNGNILYEVMAPPVLSHISEAYAVSVSGESMSPRYEDGELCFIDPSRRVKKGDYVVAQIRFEEEGPILAFVKKFIRHNAQELVLEQFNPPKELRFNAENVYSVDYIALAGNA